MYCRNCLEQLPEGVRFCPYCGTPVTGDDGPLRPVVDFSSRIRPVLPDNEYGQKEAAGRILLMNQRLQLGIWNVSEGEEILVGRSRECRIVVSVKEVSRYHCRIRWDGHRGQYLVVDISRGGLFLASGERLAEGKTTALYPNTRLIFPNRDYYLCLL